MRSFGSEDAPKWLAEIRSRLLTVEKAGVIHGHTPRILYFLLQDALRVGEAALFNAERGLSLQPKPAEPVRLMCRRLLEQAILAAYFAAQPGDETVERFRKTFFHEFQRSRDDLSGEDREAFQDDAGDAKGRLPDYWQMAKETEPSLYSAYRFLTHSAHPRGSMPYSLMEFEAEAQGIAPPEYYLQEVQRALALAGLAMEALVRAFDTRFEAAPRNGS